MKIRYAKSTDIPQLKEIWLQCFDDTIAFVDLFLSYKNYWKALVVEHECKLLSMLFILPTANRFWYIYALCTLPPYRKTGLMAHLLNETYLRSVKHGQKGLVLLPANDKLRYFYSKLAFTPFSSLKKVVMTPLSADSEIKKIRIPLKKVNEIRANYFKEASAVMWKDTHLALTEQSAMISGGKIITFSYGNAMGYAVIEIQKYLTVKEIAIDSDFRINNDFLQQFTNFLKKEYSFSQAVYYIEKDSPVEGESISFAMIKSSLPLANGYLNLALD